MTPAGTKTPIQVGPPQGDDLCDAVLTALQNFCGPDLVDTAGLHALSGSPACWAGVTGPAGAASAHRCPTSRPPSRSSAVIRSYRYVISRVCVDRVRPEGRAASAAFFVAQNGSSSSLRAEPEAREVRQGEQVLHSEGVPVVGDEPEAAHRLVPTAEHLAARHRMSCYVSSSRTCLREAAG